MNEWASKAARRITVEPERLLNKTFHRFLFSFIAIIAGVLLFILVLGVGSGA